MRSLRYKFGSFTLGAKVAIIFTAALILLGALAWGFSKPWRGPWRDQLPKVVWINLRAHLINVVDQMENPPKETRARELLKDLRLDLLVREGETVLFATTVDLPKWDDVLNEIRNEERLRDLRPTSLKSRLGDFLIGRVDSRMFAVVERHGRNYVFFAPFREGLQAGLRAFSGFAFTMAFLMLTILIVTNWLLRPMKPLMVGVGEIAKGNLDYRVSIKTRGEFRHMAEAFNGMAEKIQLQLKSKDRLLMDVSHELRSPLGRIKMAAEMLPQNLAVKDESLPTASAAFELRQQIQSDVREMEELVSELLELYRLSESVGHDGSDVRHLQKKPTDLSLVLRDVLNPLLSEKPGVEYRVLEGPWILPVDPRLMKRALRNLIENAIKFSKHQTRAVEIRMEKAASKNGDDLFVVEIQDHGLGMTDEQSQRMFEPFFRADSSRVRETGGFGLGLSMAQAIIQSHGGKIEGRSEVGRGTTFRIELPVST